MQQSRIAYGIVFCLLLVIGTAYVQSARQEPLALIPVTREDVRKTISKVGMIISERDTPLRFVSTDSVSQILVEEGQQVHKGQKLATVDSKGLAGAVMTASAVLKTAESRLEALQQGARPEEIAVIQAQIDSKKAEIARLDRQLQNAQSALDVGEEARVSTVGEADERLESTVTAANGSVSAQYSKTKTALASIESVFNRLDVQDAIVKSLTTDVALLHAKQLLVEQDVDRGMQSDVTPNDAELSLANIRLAHDAITPVANLFTEAVDVLSRLPTTNYFTSAARESASSVIVAQQSIIQESLSRLNDSLKNIQEALARVGGKEILDETTAAASEEGIDDIQAQIVALQAALNVEEAQLVLKTAPPLKSDVDQASARVRQAQGDLSRVMAEYERTILISPVDGTVIAVSLDQGQSPSLTEPAIILRSTEPRSVLVNLSDEEMGSIALSSTGSIAFDAAPDASIPLRMDEMSPSSTKIDGIGNYRKLPFRDPHPEFSDGMSGNVTIVLQERRNVLTVPTDLVKRHADGTAVVRIKRNGQIMDVTVVLGLQGDDGKTEVREDITERDVLIVSNSSLF